jgi:hypothetical protein
MKHIKFQATPTFNGVDVVILEQAGLSTYRATNNVTLMSDCCPRQYLRADNTGTVCLRGRITYRDNEVINFSTAQYAAFKAAVEEFNKVNAVKMVAPKHIQIKATPTFTGVDVEILSQTCYTSQFGTADAKGLGAAEFIHGNIRLASCKDDKVGLKSFIPKRHHGKSLIGTFYVLRSGLQATYTRKATVTTAVFAELRAAVEAYNAKYAVPTLPGGTKPKKVAAPVVKATAPVAPKTDACTIIVG